MDPGSVDHASTTQAALTNQERSLSAPVHLRLDRDFVALVDGRFADAARRSGSHLLCRPGCSQCCVGVFAIGPADILRARQGIAELAREDPERAVRVRTRAAASWLRLRPDFPGDPATGQLTLDAKGELLPAFDAFANNEPCPALDPTHGTCDIYTARPLTCRVYGPPLPIEDGYGVCELCFEGAAPAEIAAAALNPVPPETEHAVDRAAIAAGAPSGNSVLAFVLAN